MAKKKKKDKEKPFRATKQIKGHRIERTSMKSQKEAEEKLQKAVSEYILGLEKKKEKRSNTTVGEYAREWLRINKEPKSTIPKDKGGINARYYSDLENFVKKYLSESSELKLGKMRLVEVELSDIQEWLNHFLPYSISYQKKAVQIIRQVFLKAYANKRTDYFVAAGIEPPKAEEKKRRAITPEERELILKVAEYHRGGLFVLICLFTGMRPGEVAALRWESIDLEHRAIYVREALKAEGKIEPYTKSAAGMRMVPIPQYLLERLSVVKNKTGLVCTNTKGNEYRKSSIRDMWQEFKLNMHIEAGGKVFKGQIVDNLIADDLHMYCLRHTYATDLAAAGIGEIQRAKFLGHSTVNMTNRYTHFSEEAWMQDAEKVYDFYDK